MFIPAVRGEPSWTCKSVIIRHFTWLLRKKVKVFAGFLLQFLHMCGIFTYKSVAKRLTGGRACTQGRLVI